MDTEAVSRPSYKYSYHPIAGATVPDYLNIRHICIYNKYGYFTSHCNYYYLRKFSKNIPTTRTGALARRTTWQAAATTAQRLWILRAVGVALRISRHASFSERVRRLKVISVEGASTWSVFQAYVRSRSRRRKTILHFTSTHVLQTCLEPRARSCFPFFAVTYDGME